MFYCFWEDFWLPNVHCPCFEAGSGIHKLLEKMAFSKLPNGELHDVSYLLRCHVEDWWGNTFGIRRMQNTANSGWKQPGVKMGQDGLQEIARNDQICDPMSLE